MSTKRPPLLSDEQIVQIGCGILHKDDIKKSRSLQHLFNAKYLGALQVRDIYEAARAKDAELIQRLVDAGNTMKQWLGLTLQMDGESCPDCRYDWGKGHNAGCYQLRHLEAIEAWDAAAHGFKPSEQ